MKKAKKSLSAFLSVALAFSCCLGSFPITYAASSETDLRVQTVAASKSGSPDDVELYPDLPIKNPAADCSLSINGKNVTLDDHYKARQARVIHKGNGPLDVVVSVKSNIDLTTCDVYPRRAEVYPVVDTNAKTVSFTITPEMLETSYQYIISIPGLENIILMVDAPETDKPDSEADNVYNVMDQEGVKNDGTKCTAAIQAAIDKVGEDPNLDILYFPDGLYVTGRLEIKHDNVAIYLSSGTMIKGASDATNTTELEKDYPFGETGYGHNDRRNGSVFIQPMGKRTMIGSGEDAHYEVEPIKNFKLYGRGVIDGSGKEIYSKVGSGNDNQANWIHLFEAKDVDGLVVKDVIMRNSSNWCFKLENVNDAQIDNVKAINSTDQRYADGMDLSSVTNADYNNCMSYSQDDAIAIMTLQLKNETNTGYAGPPQGPTENVTFKNHLGYTDCSAVRIGWDSTDEMNNLTFDGCEWAKYDAGGLNIHRLQYDNKYGPITFKNCRWDNADNKGMKTFATCYGTDGNGFSPGQINAEQIKFENCLIDGMYQGAFNIQGKTIDKVIFDSTRISNGTPTGLVTSKEEIPHLNTTGAIFEFKDTYGIADSAQQGRYQAETMPLSGSANLSTNTEGYDGFAFVRNLNTISSGITFTVNVEEAGDYDLAFRYSTGQKAANNLNLSVNGTSIKDVYFTSTGQHSAWSDHVERVTLNQGKNTIVLKAPYTAEDSAYLDYLDVSKSDPDAEIPPQDVNLYDTLEAEVAVIKGGTIVSDSAASQTKAVNFKQVNDSVQYGDLKENAQRLVIRYQADQDTAVTIYNGTEKGETVSLPDTQGNWEEVIVNQDFAKGFQLKLQKDAKNADFSVDYVKFEEGRPALVNLAEKRTATTNANIMSDHWRWYGVDNVVDGVVSTSGGGFRSSGSASASNPHDVLIDLEQQADIYEINLICLTNKPQNIAIYAGNAPEDLTLVSDVQNYSFSDSRQTVIFNDGQNLPINARYLKLSCQGPSNFELNEVEVMGVKTSDAAGPRTNVAQFKPVTYNNYYQVGGSNGYCGLNDWVMDDSNAKWQGYTQAGKPIVIEYDLLRDYELNGFSNAISVYENVWSADMQVEVKADGADEWETVYTRKSTRFEKPANVHNMIGWTLNFDFDKTAVGRYAKITIYDTTSYGNFTSQELGILGSLVMPQGVELNRDALTMTVNGEADLTSTVTPENATVKKVSWSSSDTSVATVDANGKVTAKAPGTVIITARTTDGNMTDTCKITVEATGDQSPITAVGKLNDIEVPYGTQAKDLPLPQQVQVTLENQKTLDLAVDWDTSAYKGEENQNYTLTGTLIMSGGAYNPEGLTASVKVVVGERPPKAEKAITNVTQPEDISVAQGTAFEGLNLPEQVEVTLDDNSTLMLNVAWNQDDYKDFSAGAVNTITGSIELTEQEEYIVTNPKDLKAEITVTVLEGERKNLALPAEFTVLRGWPQWGQTNLDVVSAHDDKLNTEMILGYHPDHGNDWQPTASNPHKILIKLKNDAKIDDIITYRSDANTYTMDVSVGMTPDSLEKISTQKTYTGSSGANTPVSVILDDGKNYPERVRYVQIEVTKTGDNSTKLSELQIMGIELGEEVVKHQATVENGTGSGKYAEGATVNIEATIPEGKMFDKWVSDDGVTFADANAASTSFTMPNKDVTVTATFKDPEEQKDKITGMMGFKDITVTEGTAAEDLGLPAQAKVALYSGKTMDINVTWDTSDYKGVAGETYTIIGELILPDNIINPNQFTPSVKVIVTEKPATYQATVESGTGSGKYAEGATVNIEATIPEGKVFDKWISDDGVTFADANAASTSFTMPNKDVTVTATFKDADIPVDPVNKDALRDLYNLYKDMTQGNYTNSTWENFTKALDHAKDVLDDSKATQEQVNNAKQTLQDAFDLLTERADTQKLQDLYDRYKDMEQGDYTDRTWDIFEKALNDAKHALADDNISQAEVDAAEKALQEAIDQLSVTDSNEGDNSTDLPQTGDTGNLILIILLAVLGSGSILVALRLEKKQIK